MKDVRCIDSSDSKVCLIKGQIYIVTATEGGCYKLKGDDRWWACDRFEDAVEGLAKFSTDDLLKELARRCK